MNDLKNEMKALKSGEKTPKKLNKLWKEVKINNNLNIQAKISLINYRDINEDKVIIFGGNNNLFYCYKLDYDKKSNELKETIIEVNEELPIFYNNYFLTLEHITILDNDNKASSENSPLNINFDMDGNLWAFYSHNLRRIELTKFYN